jgi:hypothetical protein
MLRRIPTTLLVCLAVCLTAIMATYVSAAGPDEPLEVLLKPDPTSTPIPVAQTAKSRATITKNSSKQAVWLCPPAMGISKCKPQMTCMPYIPMQGCILPSTRVGQWDMSVQAFFARTRGKIQWPKNNWWNWAYWRDVDFNDDLQLPAHKTLAQFTAKYQFRPNWAIRYSVMSAEFNGGGQPTNNYGFYFGNQFFSYGQQLNSKWQHTYQRLGVVYDAVRTCNAAVAVFADWVHADDRIDVNCATCGWQTSTFSKGTDSAMVGLEFQRCLKTMANGGTFSCDNKAGVIFLDDVEGWDVQAGARYSIPLNYGRWGYMKGGYRLVDLKKNQADFLFNNTLEGGYMEFGFIF